ncbi:MAG: DNA methyltransferase, partial [Methanosarcinales archaeon]
IGEKMRNEIKEKLKSLLKELFQFENEDLDFGIYRIMNYKKEEIKKFIDENLIDTVKEQLNLLSEEEKQKLIAKLEEVKKKDTVTKYLDAIEKREKAKADVFEELEDVKEYKKIKDELDKINVSEDLEREVYNHLINFFSRYYDKGDFISKRRYGRNEKYVIPYNGEEVLLYWANKDQYYIKTTEYFRKYTFKVRNDIGLTVNFRVVDVEEEKGNAKAQEKKFFVLSEKPFELKESELDIYFEYRALNNEEKKEFGQRAKQDDINQEIIESLKQGLGKNAKAVILFTEENGKTILEKHLNKYTKRNTMDYFIHKDLKGFLERELDFYIKNEVLDFEDMQRLDNEKLRNYLLEAKVIKNIALKIIEFLAQIEEFQKKLWEKKKFVIRTDYVITLDKINDYAGKEFLESILDEILKNDGQLKEWEKLFGIEVKSKNDLIANNTLQGNEWKKLPIDTKYFDGVFKWKFIIALSENNDLDDIINGVLIKSENWQALNLLLGKYGEKVKCIYIDPPFNKENEADYLYKVGYKDATWITMLENRIKLGRELLNEKGSIFVRCDYNGNAYVRHLQSG